MKKFYHICLAVLLSMTLLTIGSSITVTRCAHTGTVKVVTVFDSGSMGDMSCDMNASCMTTQHFELSPTNMVQSVDYNFHVMQPLLAILPCLVAEWLVPTEHKAVSLFIPQVWKSPPRDYLNFIRILLI